MVRVGPVGVELLLDAAVDWAPGAFRVADDGHTWLLDSDVDREALWPVARDELAWLPLLVPVGDDPSGTYLLHLEPGQEVALEGPASPGDAGGVGGGRQVLAVGRAGERGCTMPSLPNHWHRCSPGRSVSTSGARSCSRATRAHCRKRRDGRSPR